MRSQAGREQIAGPERQEALSHHQQSQGTQECRNQPHEARVAKAADQRCPKGRTQHSAREKTRRFWEVRRDLHNCGRLAADDQSECERYETGQQIQRDGRPRIETDAVHQKWQARLATAKPNQAPKAANGNTPYERTTEIPAAYCTDHSPESPCASRLSVSPSRRTANVEAWVSASPRVSGLIAVLQSRRNTVNP